MLFEKNSVLLMIGDSITDCGRGRPVGEGDNLGAGYVNFIGALLGAKFPRENITVKNTGISGDTVKNLDARWQADVLDLAPDYLSILIGVNDVWRRFDSPDNPELAVGLAEYDDLYRGITAKAKKNVKKIILMTPFLAEQDKTETMMALLSEYIEAVKKIAAENNFLLVDLQAEFDRYMAWGTAPKALASDRVHPSQLGSVVIAKAFLKVCGVDI
ncbi:MAG: SGNH/GDSL hydrolase family protein [Oscillospiraceae bacterium]|nr:SGNH/GDSL hydrolase family protein [Oscillospiraceae bacterium]